MRTPETNSDLRKTNNRVTRRRVRQQLKGHKTMKQGLRIMAATAVLGVAVAGVSLVGGTTAVNNDSLSAPVPCVVVQGVLVCDASPVASPVATATVEPTVTATVEPTATVPVSGVESITQLPSTGAGPGR